MPRGREVMTAIICGYDKRCGTEPGVGLGGGGGRGRCWRESHMVREGELWGRSLGYGGSRLGYGGRRSGYGEV